MDRFPPAPTDGQHAIAEHGLVGSMGHRGNLPPRGVCTPGGIGPIFEASGGMKAWAKLEEVA